MQNRRSSRIAIAAARILGVAALLFLPVQRAEAVTTSTTLPSGLTCGDPAGMLASQRPRARAAGITASDALFTLRVAVGAGTCVPCVCDVNGSGEITASDALAVLKAAVGASVELACPSCDATTTTTSPPITTSTTTTTTVSDAIETQVFTNACVRVAISQPIAGQAVVFTTGTVELQIDHSTLGDSDLDGFEEVQAELTEFFFSETGTAFGDITVELADPSIHPGLDRRALGEIEENLNATPGALDLPPYVISGSAETTFEAVYLQATVSGGLASGRAHHDVPLKLEGTFTNSPPNTGDVLAMENVVDIPLLNDGDGSFFGVVIDAANGATLELAADDCD